MARPRSHYRIGYCPRFKNFRPQGCGVVECLEISRGEAEALRLKNLKGLSQTAAAAKMNISQSTFQRLLASAYQKVSEALILGRPLMIAKQQNK